MKWFRKQTAPAGASVQLREAGHHPFGLLGQYVPMRSGEIRLYRAVREAVPVVDAAIYKLIRMVGGVTAACSDPAAERGLGEFLRTVPAGRGQYGVNAFLEGYLDALLTCGRAIGEIVPAAGNREIAAVLWGRVEDSGGRPSPGIYNLRPRRAGADGAAALSGLAAVHASES